MGDIDVRHAARRSWPCGAHGGGACLDADPELAPDDRQPHGARTDMNDAHHSVAASVDLRDGAVAAAGHPHEVPDDRYAPRLGADRDETNDLPGAGVYSGDLAVKALGHPYGPGAD